MPKLKKRKIAAIFGTGADALRDAGIRLGTEYKFPVCYSVNGKECHGNVKIQEAVIGKTKIYVLDRHGISNDYTPAYDIDARSNIYASVKECGAKVILATSVVGGCKTKPWPAGTIVAIRDCVNVHGTHSIAEGEPYVHAYNLFDPEITDIVLDASKRLGIPVEDGGVYFSDPSTTGGTFETPAEMQRILASAYQQTQIDALAGLIHELRKNNGLNADGLGDYWDKFVEARGKVKDRLWPTLVGMTASEEAKWTRKTSSYKDPETGEIRFDTKYVAFAIISDVPEGELTDHGKNVELAMARMPEVVKIYAEAIPEIDRRLRYKSKK